jgi:shikimate kinase
LLHWFDQLKKSSGKTVRAKQPTHVRSNRPRAAKPSCGAVFLVGFMGAGKSSVGRALAERLNWVFEDLDDRIERREGRTVPEIFRNSGEPGFRRAEHGALRSVIDELSAGALKIIALGGGAFVQEKNAALLQSSGAPTVFLDAPADELWQRCSQQAAETGVARPLLNNAGQFRKLYDVRRKKYLKASHRIETGNRTVDDVAAEIEHALGLKKIAVRAEQGEVE